MRLRVPVEQSDRLRAALARAGSKEIGGQLFGEQLAPSDFRVTELTFQKRSGTFARFFVDLIQAARDAARFFERTKHQYARFNYIGEWHSHPSFVLEPSGTDTGTMLSLVSDTGFRGSFAVMMIVRLDADEKISSKAWLFDPVQRVWLVDLEFQA